MTENKYHNPVLLHTSVEALKIKADGTYVDVTFGGGGHSKEILKHLSPKGKLIAFDQDADAQANAIADSRFVLVPHNFRYLKRELLERGIESIDGLLADLGVSSHQFDEPSRGFSIRFDADLDMRMNQQARLTAKEVLATYEEHVLRKIFRTYGEFDNAAKLAWKICSVRNSSPIETADQLKAIAKQFVRPGKENSFYAQIFQALRIEVNQELDALKELLEQGKEMLVQEGRMVVISYHSLEDRLVKNFLRSGKFEGDAEKDFYGNPLVPFKLITRKPIVPDENEINDNPRARSARLRVAERI